jgi:HD-GYP domain-containing protein (c-di-GMP phosphodiesterase class II)
MTDKRIYKAARSREEAVAELKRCSGAQFDPGLVETFLGLPEELAGDFSGRQR